MTESIREGGCSKNGKNELTVFMDALKALAPQCAASEKIPSPIASDQQQKQRNLELEPAKCIIFSAQDCTALMLQAAVSLAPGFRSNLMNFVK